MDLSDFPVQPGIVPKRNSKSRTARIISIYQEVIPIHQRCALRVQNSVISRLLLSGSTGLSWLSRAPGLLLIYSR